MTSHGFELVSSPACLVENSRHLRKLTVLRKISTSRRVLLQADAPSACNAPHCCFGQVVQHQASSSLPGLNPIDSSTHNTGYASVEAVDKS